MSSNSAIEWTEATWNPIAGCTPVSPGCLNCYAATMSHRLDSMGQAKYAGLTVLRNGVRTFNGKISFDEAALSIPLKRKKPCVYFVNSMSDLFHEAVPFEFVDKVFSVMAMTPRHVYQVLTKRPERMAEYLGSHDVGLRWAMAYCRMDGGSLPPVDDAHRWTNQGLPNVWLGTSCENQKTANERIPHLLNCPAAIRFISAEPLLDAIDLSPRFDSGKVFAPLGEERRIDCGGCTGTPVRGAPVCPGHDAGGIDWVIVGGESGAGARPCNVEWVRSLVEQCKAANVPAFVKQLGSKPVEPAPGMEVTREVNQPFMGSGWLHLRLNSSKGGDPEEWASDLRVREMPRVAALV